MALIDQNINDSLRTIGSINSGKWPWLEFETSVLTVASQEYVNIPNNVRRVMSVRQQNGTPPTSVIYIPRMVFDAQRWDVILAQMLGTSNVPFFCYQKDTQLFIQPIPSESADIVWLRARRNLRDLSFADYSTGTITTATIDSTTVIGTGTSWTASMAGRWIRITATNAANGGDGFWYEIASVTNGTTLVLDKPYQGTSIAGGTAAYVIGEMSYIPEAYDTSPCYRAAAMFWQNQKDLERAKFYWNLYDGGQEVGGAGVLVGGLIGQMLEESNESMEGPYIPPTPRSGVGRGEWPPYWFPYDDATGF